MLSVEPFSKYCLSSTIFANDLLVEYTHAHVCFFKGSVSSVLHICIKSKPE